MPARTVYRACNLCEAICGLEITLESNGAGEKITRIKGDADDPFSRGHICPKGAELGNLHGDPDRLRRPVKRNADGTFTEISWVEALNYTAENLHRIKERDGADAVGVYLGNPNVHNYGSLLFGPRFFSKIGTKNHYSATSVDQLPHHFAAYFMFGHQFLLPVPDIDRTQYFLIMGANPLASNGSIMTVPDVRKRLKAIQERGGRFVTVDPRRTETAELADEHVFIKPGTDAYFLLAILQTLFAENLTKQPGKAGTGALEFSKHYDELRELVLPYSAERAAKITGIGADDIRRIAREFAAAESAVAYGRIGLSTQPFGALCQWLLNAINVVTGNLDRPGGAMFPLGAADVTGGALGQNRGAFDRYRSRVRQLPEFGGEFPVATMADELLTPGPGQIRSMITAAGNPVLSTPNGARLDEALADVEFMVSIDFYINETTRRAHVILPPTSPLEHEHYDLIFHVFGVRNFTRISPAVFEKEDGMLHDWEIYSDLAKRLDLLKKGRPLPDSVVESKMSPLTFLDHFLTSGPYAESHDLSVANLEQNPHGIDLGPLQPLFPKRLRTEDQRIDLAPEVMRKDLQRLEQKAAEFEAARDGLWLIGRRHLRSNNSWMHNIPKLMAGKSRCTLLLHPDDAQRLGVRDGGDVRVVSRTGSVVTRAEVSDAMMPGVVSLPHGFGHHRKGVRLSVAAEDGHAGVSINDLTDEQELDELSGNAAFCGLPVSVSAV